MNSKSLMIHHVNDEEYIEKFGVWEKKGLECVCTLDGKIQITNYYRKLDEISDGIYIAEKEENYNEFIDENNIDSYGDFKIANLKNRSQGIIKINEDFKEEVILPFCDQKLLFGGNNTVIKAEKDGYSFIDIDPNSEMYLNSLFSEKFLYASPFDDQIKGFALVELPVNRRGFVSKTNILGDIELYSYNAAKFLSRKLYPMYTDKEKDLIDRFNKTSVKKINR